MARTEMRDGQQYQIFANIDEFYTLRGGRWSGESDYGRFNRNDLSIRLGVGHPDDGIVFVPAADPDFRVSHVHDTGDFYGVVAAIDNLAEVALLGTVGSGHAEPDVYAHFSDWAETDEGPGRDFTWFVGRIKSFQLKTLESGERGG